MARVSPIQESFSAGEIDERLRGHVSLDSYARGLKRSRNWYPLVQGPIRMREGSKFLNNVDPQNFVSGAVGTQGIRVFTFQRGLDQDAIVEVGPSVITVRNSLDGGPVTGGVTGNLLNDPFWQNGFPSTEWVEINPFQVFNTEPTPTTIGFSGPHVPPPDTGLSMTAQTWDPNGSSIPTPPDLFDGWRSAGIGTGPTAPIIVPAGSELELNQITVKFWFSSSGPGFPSPTQQEILAPLGLPYPDPQIKIRVGTTPGGFDVLDTLVVIPAATTDFSTIQNFIPGAGNNTLFLTVGLWWTGTTDPVPAAFFGPAPNDFTSMSIRIYGTWEWVAPLAGGAGSPVEFVSPYTTAQLECLQFCMDPGEQVAYFTHPEVETQRLRLDVGDWTFEPLSTITLPTVFQAPTPNTWAGGNFPAACALHEGRLWLAGSPNEPATIWASASGNYQDFDNITPNDKADPLLFPLSSAGNIQTLTSRKELVILTDISEVIGTSVQGVIAFDDFSFPKQTDWGSNCIQPIVVGRDMVFTSNSRTRVRTFSDEGGTNFGWDGNELSLLAQSIFGSAVRRMEYLDEPAYQACFLLADGSMGMATFFYPEEVIGWWRYTTSFNGDRTSGDTTQPGLGNQFNNATQPINQIMDITKINTSAGAKLWMVINRVGYPGTLLPQHELLGFESGLVATLDSCVFRQVDAGSLTISDIDHLTDQSINVVIQRVDPITGEISYTVHPNITAIAGVSSPLEPWTAALTAYVGLFYDNDWQLLSREGVSNRGTSQASQRRWNKVFARLNDSPIPLIEGIRARERTPATPMGIAEPFITGDTEMVDLGSGEADLKITQDKPLITEVSAIFGKVISEEV